MLDLRDLHCFVTAYERQGFARAAVALHTVQSSVSTRIRRLERALGAPLFVRLHRHIVPTARGTLLYGYAKRVLGELDELEGAIKDRHAA